MASVHLPNELWCSAWEYLSIMECFAIAQVCRSWRRTACAWPRLWTQLSFDYYPKSNRIPYNRFGRFVPYGRQLETKPYETWLVITEVQLLDLFAERSAPMLLKFKIKVLRDCVGDEKDQAERLVEFSQLLARNASRLRSLVITTDSVILVQKILSGLPRCLPHLETLFIGDCDQRGDPIDLDFDTPALKNLQLYGLVPSRDLFNLTTSSLRFLDGGVYDSQDALRLLACAGTVQELQVEVHSNFHPTDAETQMIRQRLPPRLDTLQLRCHFNTDMTHGYALSSFYDAAIRKCSLFLDDTDAGDLEGFWPTLRSPPKFGVSRGANRRKNIRSAAMIRRVQFSQTVGPARPMRGEHGFQARGPLSTGSQGHAPYSLRERHPRAQILLRIRTSP
ncbi:hypothetical protein BKA62DRAFT_833283 [Auriculariales sp. MPI-PUGE-AT-0066]|nr:hypothetical protein BKA62DRAFT_833283 [Auriculariales sp. MPI-PUGE-AT-0066]